MTNYVKFETGSFSNIMALSIESGKPDYPRAKVIPKVSERFLQTAALLSKNEILGWQISADEDKSVGGCVFSSPGIKVTEKDFNWIFRNYGKVDSGGHAEIRDLYEENRRVYALSSVPVSSGDDGEVRKTNDDLYDYYVFCDEASDYSSDMFTMLMEEDAVIRIIAGSSDENSSGQGMVLISLPGEMTLRLKSLISLTFPYLAAKEIGDFSGEKKDEVFLPDEILMDGMSLFMFYMMCRASERTSAEKENSEKGTSEMIFHINICGDEFGEESDDSPVIIEELDLSIRSYNALKRAGINYVKEIRNMTDEDLIQIPHLRRENVQEIRQKIEEARATGKSGATEESGATRKTDTFVPLNAPSYMDMLNDLIGLENVKEQIRKIAAFAHMKKEMAENGKDDLALTLNMEFVGNPGTAKTTVARIVAGIFNETGILPGDGLIDVGRADLVAEYEGQTAVKVKEVFQKAKGKVLFIDEAYSLVENWEGLYGDEAINTIVQEMENRREDTVVIFAGYPDKMKRFFARNPGLRSRVPFSITFKDYSADEMLKIAEFEAQKRGFSIGMKAKEKVLSICREAAEKPDSGNGRFCRNLVENAILGYASRVYGGEASGTDGCFELLENDFTVAEMSDSIKKKNPIGFRSACGM